MQVIQMLGARLRRARSKMIKNKTGFIIGAGASKSYEMPTGRELRDRIISQKANAGYFQGLKINGYDKTKFESFCFSFEKSNVFSIDKYLNLHPEFMLEGKLTIAFTIKQAEIHSYEILTKLDWLQYLYNSLIDDIPSNDEYDKINQNKVYFCTFNYDRLLEYFIASSFFYSFNQNKNVQQLFTDNQFENISKNFSFKIDHVYGMIGNIFVNRIDDDQEGNVVSYFNDIQLIKEREKDISHILERLELCERIFFLGYGFNKENNDLLELSRICKGKMIYATAYHAVPEEINNIVSIIGNTTKIEDCSCYELLRKYL
jgi:hypothetical protein